MLNGSESAAANIFGKRSKSLRHYSMAERPPIQATGQIVEVLEADRLYRVEMANGYRAYAIVERKGPRLPAGEAALGKEVRLLFSPFDMSKCRLADWGLLP
jgi:hypothetical protein